MQKIVSIILVAMHSIIFGMPPLQNIPPTTAPKPIPPHQPAPPIKPRTEKISLGTSLEEGWQLVGPHESPQPFLLYDIKELRKLPSLREADQFYQAELKKSEDEWKMFNQTIAQQKLQEVKSILGTNAQLTLDVDGYIHIKSSYFSLPPAHLKTLNDFIEAQAPSLKDTTAHILVMTYKIHLMPQTWNDLCEFIKRFFNALKANYFIGMVEHQKKQLISDFKIRVAPLTAGRSENPLIMPSIVIYVYYGKEAAQQALNKVVELAQRPPAIHGLGIPPRYNAVVNDLVFVAQGDGEYKGGKYAPYYEQPRQAYYRPEFSRFPQEGYHLKNPITGRNLE